MSDRHRFLELRCSQCRWRASCGPNDMLDWLQTVGKARRGKARELDILYEVFRAAASQFACPRCGHVGLAASNAVETGAWPEVPSCRKCGRAIEKERIEALPAVRVCAACQREIEWKAAKPDREFCPRCGAPLEVRAVTEGRRTRYVLACSAIPPCPL